MTAVTRWRFGASFPVRAGQRRVTDPLQVIALCHERFSEEEGGSGKERRRGRGEESLLYLISVFTTRVSTTSEALDMGCGMSGEQ